VFFADEKKRPEGRLNQDGTGGVAVPPVRMA